MPLVIMGAKGSGRKPKPTTVKLAEGNPGGRKLNRREPKSQPALYDERVMSLTPHEQKFWDHLFPIVSEMRVMKKADIVALTELCHWLAEEWECTLELRQSKRVVERKNYEGETIGVSSNPLARLRSDAAKHVRAYLTMFGLTPSARAGLQADAEEQAQDPIATVQRSRESTEPVN